jgi:hypothetical protein
MADMKSEAGSPSVSTLIGDLVGSRSTVDRRRVHRHLRAAVDGANKRFDPVTPLRITVGDEYQGAFASVGQAIDAALWLRLAIVGDVDVRHGIGWGRTSVLQDEPRVEDGSGWWVARDAIEEAEAMSRRPGLHAVRTVYRCDPASPGPAPDPINAALLARDQLIGQGDDRWRRILAQLLEGSTQADVAQEEGVSPSAISQRVRNDGIAVVLATQELLRRIE